MSTANHTPGPWQLLAEEVDKPYIRVRGTRLGGRYKVANVVTPTFEDVHPREAEETRANARLIAAAPEMLEMLEAVYDWQHGHGSGVTCTETDLRKLIAKAKGGAV